MSLAELYHIPLCLFWLKGAGAIGSIVELEIKVFFCNHLRVAVFEMASRLLSSGSRENFRLRFVVGFLFSKLGCLRVLLDVRSA